MLKKFVLAVNKMQIHRKEISKTSIIGGALGLFFLSIGCSIIYKPAMQDTIVNTPTLNAITTPSLSGSTGYDLYWKIPESEPIVYSTSTEVVGEISVDFEEILALDLTEGNSPSFDRIVENIKNTPKNYLMKTTLTKNPQDNISVETVIDDVNVDEKIANGQLQLSQIEAMNTMGSVQLRGEITPKGENVSFYVNRQQKSILTLFFELPRSPVQVGDVWEIDLSCGASVNSARFKEEKSDRIRQAKLREVIKTPEGEHVAVLDYLVVESVEGEFESLFDPEPVLGSIECSYIGQGQFLIEQGRWKEFSAELISQGLISMTQRFALSPQSTSQQVVTNIPISYATPTPSLVSDLPSYELSWKIEDGESIVYNTAQEQASNVSIDYERLLGFDLDEDIAAIFDRSNNIQPNYSMVTTLTKNLKGNISVEMILDEVNTNDDQLNQLASMTMPGTVLRGEVSPAGEIVSFYVTDQQRSSLAILFELPVGPVQIGDTWEIDFPCITVNSGQFNVEKSDRIHQVRLNDVVETSEGEQIAILDYLIVESIEGETIGSVFSSEPIPSSMKCSYIGQGQFLIEQGRWKEYSAELNFQGTGLMMTDLTQHYALSPKRP